MPLPELARAWENISCYDISQTLGREMTGTEDSPAIDYRALAEFRYQIRRFLRFSEEAARAVGLEPQQHQLLLAVKGFAEPRGVTVGDLAERLQLHHNSTVELINRSVRQGLVQRQYHAVDRRQVMIALTAYGEELLARLSRHHETELRAAGPALIRALETLQVQLPSPGEHSAPHDDTVDIYEGGNGNDGAERDTASGGG